jgi:hypothetical protein
MKYVRQLDGFPDGDTFNIPSIGQFATDNYVEDTEVTMRPLDTGNFTFTITEYPSSGTYITKKNMQDIFYMNELVSSFVPGMQRAILEHVENKVLGLPESIYTANQQGSINGAFHRMAGGNTGRIELADFAYAKYALLKAQVPQTNLVAIVDPSVAYTVETLSNIVSVSNNPQWEGLVKDGITTGMKFISNVYGFDVYCSNYLPDVADSALPERDGTTTNNYSSVNGKANYFFSATGGTTLPFVGAWRQEPEVDVNYRAEKQRWEYITTARYGAKLFRPENMVTVVHTPTVT